MRAVITVIGRDREGIIARVSNVLYGLNINIEDISQTIMQEYFVMIMLVDTSKSDKSIADINARLTEEGKDFGIEIRIQHEDIFNSMHKI